MENYIVTIIIGTLVGTITRVLLLKVDYRQYPGYPHGFITHISLGLIASALGAVAVPAILKPDYTAFTFLALAAQQFREIRNMERQTLENMEKTWMVQRGYDYIEGIARTFEARNYLVMIAAFFSSLAHQLAGIGGGLGLGLILMIFALSYKTGDSIGDICEVIPEKVYFKNSLLFVGDINFMSVGLKEMRERISQDALGAIIKPKDDDARATLSNHGQRMAIAHTAAIVLGTQKDVDIPEFTPLVRKDPKTGKVALYIVPAEKDQHALIAAVNRTPVLESARIRPSKTKAGRIASD
jgi:hypothetical protein